MKKIVFYFWLIVLDQAKFLYKRMMFFHYLKTNFEFQFCVAMWFCSVFTIGHLVC